jgi:hypothetical protein
MGCVSIFFLMAFTRLRLRLPLNKFTEQLCPTKGDHEFVG